MKYIENELNGNYSKGRFIKPIGVVLHHNYLEPDQLITQCTNPIEQLTSDGRPIPPASYHVVIWKDGSRTKFVDDILMAWHSGQSEWKGKPSCNNFMLGVCFYGNSNKEPITPEQIDSFIEWLCPRVHKWRLKLENIVDHRTVSPGRKVDLNKKEYDKVIKSIKKCFA